MKTPLGIMKKAYSTVLELKKEVSDMQKTLDEMRGELQGVKEAKEQLSAQFEELRKYNSKSMELYFETVINILTNEDLVNRNIKKEFFYYMPKATGDLAIFQKGNNRLLQILKKLCDENNLTYWLQSGTLLGAVRHQGFVPWDDDLDVAMFRDDIAKLYKILKGNKDFRLAIVYDYYVKSRQIRFRTTDPDNPCFIDIYIYDYGNDASGVAFEKWKKEKESISNQFEKIDKKILQEWRENPWPSYDSPLGKKLTKYYDELLPPPNIKKAESSTTNWGLDNFPVKWNRLFENDFLFPTVKLKFEDGEYDAPRQFDAYLRRQYGNIYELPDDLVSHFHHIDQKNINIESVRKFLNE